MNAAALLDEARRYGARFSVHGDRLRVQAPAPLPDALVAELRAHKGELLALLAANEAAPNRESVTDWFEERAAITEFEGGLSREEAEQQARARTVAHFGLPTGSRLH